MGRFSFTVKVDFRYSDFCTYAVLFNVYLSECSIRGNVWWKVEMDLGRFSDYYLVPEIEWLELLDREGSFTPGLALNNVRNLCKD